MPHALALVGYGKMGRLVGDLAPHYGFQVAATFGSAGNARGAGLTAQALTGADVAVEFTNPAAAGPNLLQLAALGVPTVTGTTGWFDGLPEVRESVLRSGSALVWGPNFSVGLNLFRQVVADAARRFAAHSDYGAWGWEIHHAAKKDSPSGTLAALAADMERSGYTRPVSLSASRAGSVPGTHEIGFDSPSDTITLRHTARSREGFARGALLAARWLIGRKGVFEFREILEELR